MIFDYKSFYNWYQEHFDDPTICDQDTDAIVLFYNPTYKYPSAKPGQYGKKLRFKVTESQKVAKFLPIEHSRYFPNGMFLIADYDSKLGDSWLIFVYPRKKYLNDIPIYGVAGDHFSFCYNPQNTKKPVNFHTTEYKPMIEDGSLGITDHVIKMYADQSEIPGNMLESTKGIWYYDTAYRLATIPLEGQNNPAIRSSLGGAPSHSKIKEPIYDGGKIFQNKTFNKAFNEYKISSIIVFGFRGRYSVFLYDTKYNERSNSMNQKDAWAFSFDLDETAYQKEDLEKIIRKKTHGVVQNKAA